MTPITRWTIWVCPTCGRLSATNYCAGGFQDGHPARLVEVREVVPAATLRELVEAAEAVPVAASGASDETLERFVLALRIARAQVSRQDADTTTVNP